MTTAADPWQAVTLARVPAAGLAALASVRHLPGVGVQPDGDAAWVHWPAGRAEVARALWAVPGAAFFRPDGDRWRPFGKRLATAVRPPATEPQPVAGVIVPARVAAVPPDAVPAPLRLGVVRGGPVQPATALLCAVADLTAWADAATTRELGRVRAAVAAGRALLLGDGLPAVPRGVRFWGGDLLVPVGHRPHPPLPPGVLRDAVGATAGEIVLLTAAEAEVVPKAAFAPLTRAGVRLAAGGAGA